MSAEGQREELSMKLSEHLDNFAFQSETCISKLFTEAVIHFTYRAGTYRQGVFDTQRIFSRAFL